MVSFLRLLDPVTQHNVSSGVVASHPPPVLLLHPPRITREPALDFVSNWFPASRTPPRRTLPVPPQARHSPPTASRQSRLSTALTAPRRIPHKHGRRPGKAPARSSLRVSGKRRAVLSRFPRGRRPPQAGTNTDVDSASPNRDDGSSPLSLPPRLLGLNRVRPDALPLECRRECTKKHRRPRCNSDAADPLPLNLSCLPQQPRSRCPRSSRILTAPTCSVSSRRTTETPKSSAHRTTLNPVPSPPRGAPSGNHPPDDPSPTRQHPPTVLRATPVLGS